MKVQWSDDALRQRDGVAEYIREKFGYRYMMAFIGKVRNTTRLLAHSPNIGQIDPLFVDRAETYRSVIINGLSKLVYRIADDTIFIVGFWDTRMEPSEQAVKVK